MKADAREGGLEVTTEVCEGIPAEELLECAVGSDTAHAVDAYVTIEALDRTAEWYDRLPALFGEIPQTM